ncbi:MAG: universal stress protein [Nitrosopumilaceae archaeon]|jgi:nucleotide-binding universal stress UspA family protein|uniref:Universal stress protein n=3 Tax=Candidatus Nitrosomaritimum aestuariumsis TaxID=3342354 RepID=A0AC60W3G9_9ARCH|nr:universal stress protein [Nitrosopumilaceae archaeon]MBA4454220.1 universal stress protein [Nitrosopumilaceae archaeon]MBA4460155.1 universal stress protein [Nitrosopumilaceae archaeon]MBA4461667.1 universal stress protein [Nitrosopumilaceae archaeon]MBA4463397.1 universal stress protein [Nitrosopumilaceae archaeon]
MEFRNILVAFDSSSFANKAFKNALEIAEPHSSKITIATVVTGIYQPSLGFSMKYSKEILDKHTKLLKKIFTGLQAQARKKGLSLTLKILYDPSVSKAILNYVNSRKFDLVVIGSHGRTGVSRTILGSVANDVTHKAKCPVMVVK